MKKLILFIFIAMGTVLFSQTFKQSFSMILSETKAIGNKIDELKSKPENSGSCERLLLLNTIDIMNEMVNEQFVTVGAYQAINSYSTDKTLIDATNSMFDDQKSKAISTTSQLIGMVRTSIEQRGTFTSRDNYALQNLIPRLEGVLELAQKMN